MVLCRNVRDNKAIGEGLEIEIDCDKRGNCSRLNELWDAPATL